MAGGPCRPRSSSKIIAPNRIPLVFRTNSGSVNEPLMGGSFFCGERGGDRSIGEANLRKGRQPLLWMRPCRPLQWKRHCRLLLWKRHCRPPSLFIQNGFAGLVALGGRGARLPQRGQAPGDWQSQCACPRSFRIWSFVYIRIKRQRILSFPKALFYSLAALRIK